MSSSTSDTADPSEGKSLLEDQLKQTALLSEKEGKRLQQEAARVRAESKRLRNEADRLENEAKRLCSNSQEAIRLSNSLKFDALCQSLRRNDPSTTEIQDPGDFPIGYARPLGEALKENTLVASIEICMGSSIPSVDDVEPFSREKIKKSVDPLVQAIARSNALRRIDIFGQHSDVRVEEILAELFLGASLRNPNIEEVTFGSDVIPARVFVGSPRLARSLRMLRLSSDGSYSIQDRLTIGRAFQSFPSLTKLDLDITDTLLTQSILAGIRVQLEELELGSRLDSHRLWVELTSLVLSTKGFKHLHLKYFSFDAQNTNFLISGLRQLGNQGSLTTVSELSLSHCSLDQAARRLLLEFLNTRAAPQQAGNATMPHSLRKLNLFHSLNMENDAQTLVSMLSMTRDMNDQQARNDGKEEWYPTIGFQIESLSLDPVDVYFPRFLELLARHAPQIRLKELSVTALRQQDAVGLTDCLAKIGSLGTLKIIGASIPSTCRILQSLRANGNVQSASISLREAPEKVVDFVTKVTQAYCERNKCLDGLLLESSRSSELDQEEDGAAARGSAETLNEGKSFNPTLWAAALQVPDTQSSKVLRSLLSLCENLGD